MKNYTFIFLFCALIHQGYYVSAQSSDQNYLQTFEVQVPGITNTESLIPGISSRIAIETMKYIDGLGRPSQIVQRGVSPEGNDYIQPFTYNEVGLDVNNYLNYESKGNTGEFDPEYVQNLQLFYSSLPGGDSYGKAPVEYELSPLNRILKKGSPGASWQIDQHPINYRYLTNNYSNKYRAKHWVVSGDYCEWGNYYTNNLLTVVSTIDEDEKENLEFKNMQGQVILKRGVIDYTTFADTYYVYDDLGLLRFVISPEGSNQVPSSFDANNEIAKKYVYCYKYDTRKRLIEKQIPGKGVEYFVYNNADKVIMYQDGNMRKVVSDQSASSSTSNSTVPAHEWLFNKYDAFGRIIITGITTKYPNSSRSAVQTQADNVVDSWEILEYHGAYPETNSNYYTNRTFPTIDPNYFSFQTINYYDDYKVCVKINGQFLDKSLTNDQALEIDIPQVLYDAYSPDLINTTGFPTSCFLFYGGTSYGNSVYYDTHGRTIQSRTKNHARGYDFVTNQYSDNSSRIIKMEHEQSTIFNEKEYVFQEEIDMEYDHFGRLGLKRYRFNGGVPIQVITNRYDPLGRLVSTDIGEDEYLIQTVDYSYNMRNWLTMINDPSNISLDGDFFGEEILYDKQDNSISNIGNSRMFNGNISGIKWQTVRPSDLGSPSTTGLKAYAYEYDALNRLLEGKFSETNESNSSWIHNEKYKEKIGSYDLNGNILSLYRHGNIILNNIVGVIDSLTYSYCGNQIIAVDDYVRLDNQYDFNDHGHYFSHNVPEFYYDANGNLKQDLNKNIIEITYNYQNLPVSISKKGTDRVEYDYDPVGNKLCQRFIQDGKLTKCTDFVGNFVYEDGIPAWIIHDEGRVVFDSKGAPFAEIFLKDHLGNVRVAIRRSSGQTTIRQVDSYYPFGMSIPELSPNNSDRIHANEYLYNGKMYQDEMELIWLDYGARFYDPVLARFHTIDIKAEAYWSYSSYAYAVNSPIRLVDKNGEGPEDAIYGFIVAVTDNTTGGMMNLRGLGYNPAETSEEAIEDFNRGLVIGDAFSIALAKAMIQAGGGAGGIAGSMALVGTTIEIATAGGGTVVVVIDEALAGIIALGGLGLTAEGTVILKTAETNAARGSGQRENPKKKAREEAKAKREEQPAPEKYVKEYKAKEAEKQRGKDARRKGHDAKKSGEPNRTKKQVDEDYAPPQK